MYCFSREWPLTFPYGFLYTMHSPQNTLEAIRHLCRVTRTTHLICHPSLLQRGETAAYGSSDISVVRLAPRSAWKTSSLFLRSALEPMDEKDLPALVMHTSGSTGMPKVRPPPQLSHDRKLMFQCPSLYIILIVSGQKLFLVCQGSPRSAPHRFSMFAC